MYHNNGYLSEEEDEEEEEVDSGRRRRSEKTGGVVNVFPPAMPAAHYPVMLYYSNGVAASTYAQPVDRRSVGRDTSVGKSSKSRHRDDRNSRSQSREHRQKTNRQ